MEAGNLTDLDVALSAEVDLARNPHRYRDAIQWWNENYTARKFRLDLAADFRKRRRSGVRVYRSRHPTWRYENLVLYCPMVRVGKGMDTFPRDPSEWRRLGHRDAARILLLTVLMLRPEFDFRRIGLEEQPGWSDRNTAEFGFGREWADGSFPSWDDQEGSNGRWLKLARAAWKIMQAAVASGAVPPGDDLPEAAEGGSKTRSQPGKRFYVYCRFWAGFSDAFPFDRFNGVPEEAIVGAVMAAVEHEFEAHPELKAKWREQLEDEVLAHHREAMKHYRPVRHGAGMIIPKLPLHPDHGKVLNPPPEKEPIPGLHTELGFQHALWVLGWRQSPPDAGSRVRERFRIPLGEQAYQKRHLIAAVDDEQDAADVVTALNEQHGTPPLATKFGYMAAATLGRPKRLLYEQEIDWVRTAAEAGSGSPSAAQADAAGVISKSAGIASGRDVQNKVVSYVRLVVDLLRRMTPEGQAASGEARAVAPATGEPPQVCEQGKADIKARATAPATAPRVLPANAKKPKRGRPKLNGREEERRLELVRAWQRAKEAGTSQKDFCADNKITVATLEGYVNWFTTRQKRNDKRV